MAKTEKRPCQERVYSGQRIDMSGHMCPRNAIEGSDFCRQHHDRRNPKPVESADQNALPQARHSATLKTVLRWEPGTGPVIISYGKCYFVRRLEISLSVPEDGRGRAYFLADCAAVKKDGTESRNYSKGDYVREDQFVGEAAELIDRTIKQMEDTADVIRQERSTFDA